MIIMNKTIIFTIVLAFILISTSRADSDYDTLNVAPFGKVYIYNHTPVPGNVAILISGDGGWKSGVLGFAEAFSKMNTLVIGVDILRYFKELRQRQGECYNVAADFVQLATEIEKKYNFSEYKPPVIMGYSSGATLVYGILAQARPETFIGGISLGFCSDIELPKMLCQKNGLTEEVYKEGKSYFLHPDAKLGNPWIVLQGKLDRVCSYSDVVDFVKKTTDAELITLPNVGHGFSRWSDFMPQWKDAFIRLTTNYGKNKKEEITTVQEKPASPDESVDKVNNLPLILTTAKYQKKEAPVALLISGDGGWYGFEQNISNYLSDNGIPTVGLDAKKYFWKRRTPEETAEDIALSLTYYAKEWGKENFMLIGYSLGAELVPFILNRLPEGMKTKTKSAVLLSPATTTDFEIHISNMLGMGNHKNTYDVIEEIKKNQKVPILIILGEGEKSEVPELLNGTSVKVNKIPGDHHYKFNLPLIIKTMKDNNAF
jgi:type IV secretory pathway VirJ component